MKSYEQELNEILIRVRRELAIERVRYRELRTTIGSDDRMVIWRRVKALGHVEAFLTTTVEHARRANI